MSIIYEHLFSILWFSWGVYWVVAARGVKAAQRIESPVSRAAHLIPLAVVALLLWAPTLPYGFLCGRLLPWSSWMFWAGAAVTAAGLSFTVWARVHLGRNWSATVTVKQDHELVVTGPYQLVRHPVYTGLLLGFIGTAVARDEWRGLLAVAIAAAALWRKLRLEESWMTEQFGDAYARYRERVAALIPYLL